MLKYEELSQWATGIANVCAKLVEISDMDMKRNVFNTVLGTAFKKIAVIFEGSEMFCDSRKEESKVELAPDGSDQVRIISAESKKKGGK